MLSQRWSHNNRRIFGSIVAVALVLSFTVTGLTRLPAQGTEGQGVFLPYLVRDASYTESIGVPDISFSDDGWLLTNYSGSLDYGYAIVEQTDGSLVIAGSFDGTSQDFGLARFNSNGSEDLTFDGDGRAHTDFFGGGDVASAIDLQADGKIVVAGSAYKNATVKDEFALARYNPNGGLDTSFSGDGWVTTDFFGGADYAKAVAVQDDGKIVVAGYAYNGTDYDFALARYTPTGELDTTFSGDGMIVTDFDPVYNRSERAYAMVLDGNGLILAGEAWNGASNPVTGCSIGIGNSFPGL